MRKPYSVANAFVVAALLFCGALLTPAAAVFCGIPSSTNQSAGGDRDIRAS